MPLKARIRGRAAEPSSSPVTATRQAHGPAQFGATPDLLPFRPPRVISRTGWAGREWCGYRVPRHGTAPCRRFGGGRHDPDDLRKGMRRFLRSHPLQEVEAAASIDCPRSADLAPMTDILGRAKQTGGGGCKAQRRRYSLLLGEPGLAAQAAGFFTSLPISVKTRTRRGHSD